MGVSEFTNNARIVKIVILVTIDVLGVFGNTTVIALVLADRLKRTSTDILILSLAIADLLFLLLYAPYHMFDLIFIDWTVAPVACKIYYYALCVTGSASAYTLVILSLYRYFAVIYPIRFKSWISKKKTWLVAAGLWAVLLCANAPFIVYASAQGYYSTSYERYKYVCTYTLKVLDSSNEGLRVLSAYDIFLGYIIPLGSIVIMYSRLLCHLHSAVLPAGECQPVNRMLVNMRVTRMVFVVVVVFALCWLPIKVLFILVLLRRSSLLSREMYAICLLVAENLIALNSSINPIIYAFLSKNFRRRFRKLFPCCHSSCRVEHE